MKTISITTELILLSFSMVSAAGSPAIKSTVSKDIKYYNVGVEMMMAKQFNRAEKQFRKALATNERFAEAHNNLAYSLRKQGPDHFADALKHYNRAIELKPGLEEAYMYRGVLHTQMGNHTLALDDHSTLVEKKSPLAAELQYVVDNGREKEPEQFFGVSRRIDS